jgi:hypothetical protein
VPGLGLSVGQLVSLSIPAVVVASLILSIFWPPAGEIAIRVCTVLFGANLGLALDANISITRYSGLRRAVIMATGATLLWVAVRRLPADKVDDLLGAAAAFGICGTIVAWLRTLGAVNRSWKAFATQRGWTFTLQDSQLPRRWRGSPIAFMLDRDGQLPASLACTRIVEGQEGNLTIRIFGLTWTEGDGEDITCHDAGPIVSAQLPFLMAASIAVEPADPTDRAPLRIKLVAPERLVEHARARALGFAVYASDVDAVEVIDQSLLDALSTYPAERYGAWRIEGDTVFSWDWPPGADWFDCAKHTLRAVVEAVRRHQQRTALGRGPSTWSVLRPSDRLTFNGRARSQGRRPTVVSSTARHIEYELTHYDGGSKAHPLPERAGHLTLVGARWELHFAGTGESVSGEVTDLILDATPVGAKSCLVAIRDSESNGQKVASFVLVRTSARRFVRDLDQRLRELIGPLPNPAPARGGRVLALFWSRENAARTVAKRLGVPWPPANGWYAYKAPTTPRFRDIVVIFTEDMIGFPCKPHAPCSTAPR